MAAINEPTAPQKKEGTPKLKRKATTVDLTPMVDLGFLLITFFIFATTLAKPNAVNFRMPKDTIPNTPVERQNTLIIIADSTNKYYTYEPLTPIIQPTLCSTITAVRKNIIAKKSITKNNALYVILKLHPEAKYSNLIEMLDEVKINDIIFYVKDKLTVEEKLAIKAMYQ